MRVFLQERYVLIAPLVRPILELLFLQLSVMLTAAVYSYRMVPECTRAV